MYWSGVVVFWIEWQWWVRGQGVRCTRKEKKKIFNIKII